MKYWFLNIQIRDGEHIHNSYSIHTTKGNEKFNDDAYLREFYDDHDEDYDSEDTDTYYYQGGSIACRVEGLREITKMEYDVLKKFI